MENVIALFPQPVEEVPPFIESVHRDVTNDPVIYANPKLFVFLTRSQLDWITSNRQARQMLKEQNIIDIYDMSSVEYSIDNLKSFKVKLFNNNLWNIIKSTFDNFF